MFLGSRRILTIAAISASASVSHAGMTRNISFADSLLKYLESKGYQPSYGFSESSGAGPDFSELFSVVGGSGSVSHSTLVSGGIIKPGGGTLTLSGNSGFSDSLGTLTQIHSGNLTVQLGSGSTLGFSSGSGDSWSLITISSTSSGLVADQLPHLDSTWFSNPWNVSLYSADLVTVPQWVLIPEPSALLLGGITGSLALLRRRRTA